jgi:hypothetical protein
MVWRSIVNALNFYQIPSDSGGSPSDSGGSPSDSDGILGGEPESGHPADRDRGNPQADLLDCLDVASMSASSLFANLFTNIGDAAGSPHEGDAQALGLENES